MADQAARAAVQRVAKIGPEAGRGAMSWWSAHRCPRFRTDNLQYSSSEWPPRGPPFARAWLTLPRWSTVTGAAIIVSKSTEVTPINTLCLIWVMSSSGCAGYYLPVLRILYEARRVKGTRPGTPLRNGRQNSAASYRSCPRARPSRHRRAPWRSGTRPAGGAGRRASAVREALYAPLLAIACTAVPATSAGQRSGLAVQPQALCFTSGRRGRKNLGRPHLR